MKFKAISAFDLDHTLISENSSYRFSNYLYEKGVVSIAARAFILSLMLRFKLGLLSLNQLHQKAFAVLFKGRSCLIIEDLAKEFVEIYLDSFIYIPVFQKLKEAQSSGHLTILLSSSPNFLIHPIASKLNISYWKSTQYAVDKDQKFCHIATVMDGDIKAKILEEIGKEHGIKKEQIYAYSDSHLDLPFLLCAGTASAVNPTKKMRAICLEKKWMIIE